MPEVADLTNPIKPYRGQDLQLVFHVYADEDLATDADITGWALAWVLVANKDDQVTAAVLSKTTGSGISIATPEATVTVSAADMATPNQNQTYYHQLWRTDSGNTYPLCAMSEFIPQSKPPLS